MELDKRFTSPGEALAQQAAMERRLERALTRATRDMLVEVKGQALSHNLTAGSSAGAWERAVSTALIEVGMRPGSEAFQWLGSALLELDLGSEAYSSAQAVLLKAASTFPAPDAGQLEEAMDAALDLETPSLVAAGAAPPAPQRLLARMKRLGDRWSSKVKRSVRTGFTGFSGYVAMHAMRAAGRDEKMWVCRHDEATRSSHLEADGQVVAVERPFMVGGVPLMYPGDRGGPAEETFNCRCVIVSPR